MTEPSLAEVTTADFDVTVLERSRHIPVLVDFWAPWCGPCRLLTPVLEAIAIKRAAELVLAKVDTEAEPELGRRFAVHTLPTVKLFYRTRVVAEFVGALSGGTIESFLDRHLPTEADGKLDQARRMLAQGDREGGTAALQRALALDPQHDGVRLELATLAYLRGDAAALAREASAMTPYSEAADSAASLGRLLELACAGAAAEGGEGGDDLHARGCRLALEARWSEAMDALLEASAGREIVREILGFLGEEDEQALEYRQRLRRSAAGG